MGRRALAMGAVGLLLVFLGSAVFSWAWSREYPPEGSPDADLVAEGEATVTTTAAAYDVDFASSSGEGFRLSTVPSEMLSGNFERCPECHALLDHRVRNQKALTSGFAHGFHLQQGASCEDCHESPTHALTGTRRPPMQKCFDSCHTHDTGTGAPGACDACHPADFPLEPETHADRDWLPVRERIDLVSGGHTAANPESLGECALCHGQEFCRSCHKMDMPHPGEWDDVHADTAREVGGTACVTCHPDRKSCADCHHSGYETSGGPWVTVHFEAADQAGVQKCIGCHSTKTCAHCHTTGEYLEYD